MKKKILAVLTGLVFSLLGVVSASAKDAVATGDNSSIKLVIMTAVIALVLIVVLLVFSILTRKKK